MQKRLLWRFFPAFAAVVAVLLLLFSVVAIRLFDNFYLAQVTDELKAQVTLAEPTLRTTADIQQAVRELGERSGTRFTVVLPDGTVAADSEENPAQMTNHADRPEVRDAFGGIVGVSTRHSPTLKKELLYVAVRVRAAGETRFILRAAKPLRGIKEAIGPVFGEMSLVALLIGAAAVLVSFVVARRISVPLRRIQEGAERFAAGDLGSRLAMPETEEFARLARSLNTMAEQLRRLENIRKDFVANVSHELRTPITSIKGYVETLRDGALADREKARAFLDTIARQADRLGAIVEDLLALSKIERDNEQGDIVLDRSRLRPILEAAAQLFAQRAAERSVRIDISCDEGLSAPVSAPLLEQAIANLVDNAVKYSHDGGTVTVSAALAPDAVVITVADTGIGISLEHLPRLFERFYRVDKARSRAAGGTGLGLAIVKHIALAHKGAVSVKSEQGKGSSFSISLPLS